MRRSRRAVAVHGEDEAEGNSRWSRCCAPRPRCGRRCPRRRGGIGLRRRVSFSRERREPSKTSTVAAQMRSGGRRETARSRPKPGRGCRPGPPGRGRCLRGGSTETSTGVPPCQSMRGCAGARGDLEVAAKRSGRRGRRRRAFPTTGRRRRSRRRRRRRRPCRCGSRRCSGGRNGSEVSVIAPCGCRRSRSRTPPPRPAPARRRSARPQREGGGEELRHRGRRRSTEGGQGGTGMPKRRPEAKGRRGRESCVTRRRAGRAGRLAAGDRPALARAIALMESTRAEHRAAARALLGSSARRSGRHCG